MSTLLLAHFNGTDGATTFTDEVPGITWSRIDVGYVNEVDTARKKFGTAAWLGLAGPSNDALTDGAGFTFPASGSFTLEAFFAPTTIATTGSWVEISLLSSGDGQQAYMIMICGGGLNHWNFGVNTPTLHDASGGGSFAVNTFYHFALVRDVGAGTYSGYVNGARVVQWSDSNNLSATPIKVRLGGTYTGSSTSGIGGWIDEVRLTNEVMYSGSTYTVPSTELTLGTTTNVDAFGAEFGREVDTPIRSSNVVVQSSEYDFEADEVVIRLTQSDPQSQYGWEGGSPAIVHTHVVSVDSMETGWEISLQQDVAPGAMEYEWEAGNVGIPIDSFIGANDTPLERDWAAGSPGIYSKNFLRGVTPRRRRIIAGRRTAVRRLEPTAVVEVTANRRTAVERVLR